MHEETRYFAGRGTATEDAVHAQLVGGELVEPRSATRDSGRRSGGNASRKAADIALVLCRCASRWVTTWLDQHRVSPRRPRAFDQIRHAHLGTEVDHRELAVVLETFLPGDALEVEDRVDADRVGIGPDARADDGYPLAQPDRIVALTSFGLRASGSRAPLPHTWFRSTRWCTRP